MTDESLRDILDRIADLHRFRRLQGQGCIQLHAVITTEDERCAIKVNADKAIMDYIIKQAQTQLIEYVSAIISIENDGEPSTLGRFVNYHGNGVR